MNYQKIMFEEKAGFSFSSMYEKAIQNKEKSFGIAEDLTKILHDKREFGLKKYGESSFQGSLENCMTSPTIEHAEEEMIDCINYLLHENYKNDLRGETNQSLTQITNQAIRLFRDIQTLHNKS